MEDKNTVVEKTKCIHVDLSYDIVNPVWIKESRQALGWTYRKLGEKVGLAGSYLSDIEKGRRTLRLHTSSDCPAKRLVKVLSDAVCGGHAGKRGK